jgi:hypothetical protein
MSQDSLCCSVLRRDLNNVRRLSLQFLCVIPVEVARWGVVAAACLLSTLFLALNIRGHILHTTERWFLIVLGVVALHLALGLVLKLYFFTYFSFSM